MAKEREVKKERMRKKRFIDEMRRREKLELAMLNVRVERANKICANVLTRNLN